MFSDIVIGIFIGVAIGVGIMALFNYKDGDD